MSNMNQSSLRPQESAFSKLISPILNIFFDDISSDLSDEELEELRMISGFEMKEIKKLRKKFLRFTNGGEIMSRKVFREIPCIQHNPLQDRIIVCFEFPEDPTFVMDSALSDPITAKKSLKGNTAGNPLTSLFGAFGAKTTDEKNKVDKPHVKENEKMTTKTETESHAENSNDNGNNSAPGVNTTVGPDDVIPMNDVPPKQQQNEIDANKGAEESKNDPSKSPNIDQVPGPGLQSQSQTKPTVDSAVAHAGEATANGGAVAAAADEGRTAQAASDQPTVSDGAVAAGTTGGNVTNTSEIPSSSQPANPPTEAAPIIGLDFRSFLKGVSLFNTNGKIDEKMRVAFRIHDFDGDGVISRDDMTKYIQRVTTGLSDADIHDVVDELFFECASDARKQKITQDDFQREMASTPDFYVKLRLRL